MNILYYFAEDNSYMTQWQRIHVFNELNHYDYKINVFNPLQYASIEEANECLVKTLREHRMSYDLFMTCVSSKLLYKETINLISKLGLPTLLICFDNLHAPYLHKDIASFFDLVWLTSCETKTMFEKWNSKNIIVQPYAANPYLFDPVWKDSFYSIGFIGSPYGSRANKINKLTQSKIPCTIYNNFLNSKSEQKQITIISKWELMKSLKNLSSFRIGRKVLLGAVKNKIIKENNIDLNVFLEVNPSVSFKEMQILYSAHSLSLNITELRNTYVLKKPIHKLHLRTFEIPMAGGLEFTSYTPEILNYFEPDKEIVLYDSDEEMTEKARFYLDPKNEYLCKIMKKNARKRSVSEHTWKNRFDHILAQIGYSNVIKYSYSKNGITTK
jgi:hypothetical protein